MIPKQPPPLTSFQARAARAGLGLSLREVSKAAGIGFRTLNRFEREHCQPQTATLARVREAFERLGIQFSGATGISMRDDA